MGSIIKDDLGRSFRKLRLSLTEVCNFRCVYCMPKNPKFSKHPPTPPDDFVKVCKVLVEHGIEEIRLTGGEPLYYPRFIELVEKLSDLPLKKLALTTNAFFLHRYLDPLKDTLLNSINVSLDSLDPEKFHKITGSDSLDKILHTIETASKLGYEIKTNAVLLSGTTDEDIDRWVDFSKRTGIMVRFLEAMKIGVMNQNFDQYHVPIARIKNYLKEKYQVISEEVPWDSTAQVYRVFSSTSTSLNSTDNPSAQMGFIASETEPFCNSCSRLRVNHKLEIRPCLMKNESVSLQGLDFEDYPEMLKHLLARKPRTRVKSLEQAMFEIGG